MAPKIPKRVNPLSIQSRRACPVYRSTLCCAHSFSSGHCTLRASAVCMVDFPQRQTVIAGRLNSSDEMCMVKIAPFFAFRTLNIASEACAFRFLCKSASGVVRRTQQRCALVSELRSARLRIRHAFTAPPFFSIRVLIFPGVCDSAPPNLAFNRLLAWIEPAITKPSFRT